MRSPRLLADRLAEFQREKRFADGATSDMLVPYLEELDGALRERNTDWRVFRTFWPPRYVSALASGHASVFFGAGLSVACGIPLWQDMLDTTFGLDAAFLQDEDLRNDPLTMAELAAQFLGPDVLQSMLRASLAPHRHVSVNHALLAAMKCPSYITTNYDGLFEAAWKAVWPKALLQVVTTDGDLTDIDPKSAVLYKVHGDAGRDTERLILTRRDYRTHYRANHQMFGRVRDLLREQHTLFVGFSHSDPEVSRLVEDAIYQYEVEEADKPGTSKAARPQFYSLQFNMRAHTPEVFAARGIVALTPPILPGAIVDPKTVRTHSLAVALADLLAASTVQLHEKVALDDRLAHSAWRIEEDFSRALAALGAITAEATARLAGDHGADLSPRLSALVEQMGPLAGQGVYLADASGDILEYAVPAGLDPAVRAIEQGIRPRPYFQQAKSFRMPFIADTAESLFNGHSTFFTCVPLTSAGRFEGLVFAAGQVGQWETPVREAASYASEGLSFLLIDANGVCALPPQAEFEPVDNRASATEAEGRNIGYPYARLLALSRRDRLVRHISRSVVPVAQDDDILRLSDDLDHFTVIRELRDSRWKVAVSVPVPRRRGR